MSNFLSFSSHLFREKEKYLYSYTEGEVGVGRGFEFPFLVLWEGFFFKHETFLIPPLFVSDAGEWQKKEQVSGDTLQWFSLWCIPFYKIENDKNRNQSLKEEKRNEPGIGKF